MRSTICWTSQVDELDGGILQPYNLCSAMAPGDTIILQTIMGGDQRVFHQMEIPSNELRAVWNMTGSDQCLALCTVDPKKPKLKQFNPVSFTMVMNDTTIYRDFFACGPPVMLQAFVVPPSKYYEQQPIDTSTLLQPLFIDAGTSKPAPINVGKLTKPITAFRLYSDMSGKIVLEKE
ncbi:uncharacterized protein LACBIDRAFT_329954 [Laccaria bicolor S238N-H82]|uniref:Predicted protein n=1 Tax=Laccaria bicolor (strain S238N-H82 / ATCC MYA-4686) TaxID=486041 RepID=B0DJR1_LACBS|nr:uncharacterized protein LACBIDRAFT_329954 [Laccaria bicolor S238N-H82]EDR05254.1 predicted protein [Laccaria bicolor S238N-H82]|eukprot:XP_001884219.1 predicted protein [Laccaria bicolor S238N-H82]